MRWTLLLALGSTGCLTIHVHVPPPDPAPYPAYGYTLPPPPALPPAALRPIDASLADDPRIATAPATTLPPADGCQPPYRVTPQGIRIMRLECMGD